MQIGDGDVIRNLEIPVFMIFPRSFCCSNLETKDASISFEMNLMIVLVNGVVISQNFPVNLWRGWKIIIVFRKLLNIGNYLLIELNYLIKLLLIKNN